MCPMMVCSEEDFSKEVEMLQVDYRTLEKGRSVGKKEVDGNVRKLIASEALVGVAIDEIRERYNISASSISAYKNDATSTASYHTPNTELKENNTAIKATMSERAEAVALEAIGLLTVEKIAAAKAKDIAGIAKDMSSIMSNMRESNGDSGPKVNITIMVPPVREEQDFKVIDVGE